MSSNQRVPAGPRPLPAGWEWTRQPDVFSFRGGAQPPASTFSSEQLPGYVRLIQIRDYDSDTNITFVPDSPKLRKCAEDDIMLARYGNATGANQSNSLGRVFRGIEGAYNVALVKVTASSRVDSEFLYYLLQSRYFQEPLHAQAARSVQAGFNKTGLKNILLPLPPVDEQRRIGRTLRVIDDKIELNRRMSESLEKYARAIFAHRFLRHTLHVHDLNALLRSHPADWRLSTIGRECATVLGGTPSRKIAAYWDGHIPWINSGKARDFRIMEPTEYITKLGLAKSAAKLMPERTTVIAITGATLGQVSLTEIETTANQSIVGVLPNDQMPAEFLYYWILANIERLIARQTGGAQQHINKGDVDELPLLCPPMDVLQDYTRIVRPLFDRIKLALLETRTLSELRDTLLPKLISGELRVPQAEQLVSEAV